MEILLTFSKYITVLTGAGISTSSGIPDFRGKGTSSNTRPEDLSKFSPSRVHDLITDLVNLNIIKHVISQNIDDLHTKSGLSDNNITEIHGNMMKEKCTNCKKVVKHMTQVDGQRPCECGGTLQCTLINFGQDLDIDEFIKAEEEMKKTDLLFVIGTSMKVKPANTLPLIVSKNGGNIIIINNEPTDLDSQARLVYNCDILAVLEDIHRFLTEGKHTLIEPTTHKGFCGVLKLPEPWDCKRCTFHNTIRILECEMCE